MVPEGAAAPRLPLMAALRALLLALLLLAAAAPRAAADGGGGGSEEEPPGSGFHRRRGRLVDTQYQNKVAWQVRREIQAFTRAPAAIQDAPRRLPPIKRPAAGPAA